MEPVSYPRTTARPALSEGWRFFWTFLIPAFAGWFSTIFLFELSTSGPSDLRLDTVLAAFLVTPILMAVSLLAGTPVLCLAACLAFAAAMKVPFLRLVKPVLAIALGLAVFWLLDMSFLRDYMKNMEAEGIFSWPFWMVQYPGGAITAASAWISSALFYRGSQGLFPVSFSRQTPARLSRASAMPQIKQNSDEVKP